MIIYDINIEYILLESNIFTHNNIISSVNFIQIICKVQRSMKCEHRITPDKGIYYISDANGVGPRQLVRKPFGHKSSNTRLTYKRIR